MSKLVTLDEEEAYEAELRRAHAENRAPALRNPHEVFADNLGNSTHHLEEVSESEQKSETNKLHRAQRDAKNDDKKLLKVIRDNTNRLPDGEGSVTPYQAPDPKRFDGPKNADEKQAIADKVDKTYERNRVFDDSYSDVNIPNVDDDGLVKGDSVNKVFTRKMPTTSEEQLVIENERNSVPVPERFRTENPPQVIQASNPITGEKPTPEVTGYTEGYYPNANNENVPDDVEVYEQAPMPGDLPLTAIKVPEPNHVIGDETGTTREVSRYNESDAAKAEKAPEFPKTVPLSEGQVAQGAVKRPDHFDPPVKDTVDVLSQNAAAGTLANLPVDTTGLRGDNTAHKAVEEAAEFQPGGNVDPVYLTDEQKEYAEKKNNPSAEGTVFDEKNK